ncbi:hypothetical protein HID58_071798 [Brassica napus]|uniref:Uncharacterized protein n=1 Tax=Brassica napus TaxID=3708 RepID=A0ABQ7Z2L3_BRANA|nr:hypothetical protein HID58_071798 [Brassica napus]
MAELVAMELDLLSLDSVARFAGAWNARLGPLHVLINNAGIFAMGGWLVFKLEKSVSEVMVLDGFVSSPLRRPHALKKQWEDLGSCSTVAQRHRHLSCSGMIGKEKAMCQMEHVWRLKLL